MSFLEMCEKYMKEWGLSEKQAAKEMGLIDDYTGEGSVKKLREAKAIAKSEKKEAEVAQAVRLSEAGVSNVAAAKEMGIPESTYRTLLAASQADKQNAIRGTTAMLKAQVDKDKVVDVGFGTENYMGVSKEKKDIAISALAEDGYTKYEYKVMQLGTGKMTTFQVLAAPGMSWHDVKPYVDSGTFGSMQEFSDDGGRTALGIKTPLPISSKRVAVRYAEQGGSEADGVIYVRPDVTDVSLGNSRYAQVRIQVDDHHYLKGMAVYKDDLPDGVDLMFNTNKSDTGNKHDAFKDMRDEHGKIDPDNPFGAVLKRQILDDDGNVSSVMNILREEGDWTKWSKTISAQMLSKQDPEIARTQLNMTHESRQAEYDKIMASTNPTVKQKLLLQFADETDAAAVHLKAAQLPRQRWQVILPIESLGDHEVYAPHFNNGETVALIRYPHGGTFEIPELTVNNKHAESRRTVGLQPRDAIGINSRVAQHLSGADFDGDTVLVIPNNQGRIRSGTPLHELKNFDTKNAYPPYDGMKTVDGGHWNAAKKTVEYGPKGPNPGQMQREMGDISNLITDMTIKGASTSEIARAVRHSMVVIDSEKHSLNIKQSATDNGIRALKEKYQGRPDAGAATLISRKKSTEMVPERKDRLSSQGGPIDPRTGKKMYQETGRTIVDKKTGEVVPRTTKVNKLAETEDAFTLSSGSVIEGVYATHSNALKGMANEARRQSLLLPPTKKSASAAETYAKEVASLNAKLTLVVENKPRERRAQAQANAIFKQKKNANPAMTKEEEKKVKFQALEEARRRTGAARDKIEVTSEEWDAIQAGAISDTKLRDILDSADMDIIKQHAIPREAVAMTPAKLSRAQDMISLGYTQAEIAEALGVSTSTLDRGLHNREGEGE
jgi:hypothetical protein